MDTEIIDRSLRASLTSRKVMTAKEHTPRITSVPKSTPMMPQMAADSKQLTTALLRDAVREAGLFQRSVLGHLDHKEWHNRVRNDGQRLIDLLWEIGFTPSERPEGVSKQKS